MRNNGPRADPHISIDDDPKVVFRALLRFGDIEHEPPHQIGPVVPATNGHRRRRDFVTDVNCGAGGIQRGSHARVNIVTDVNRASFVVNRQGRNGYFSHAGQIADDRRP